MEKTETNQDKRLKVYEIGYLLLPTVPEEHLAQEVQAIKAVIEKADGSFITEDAPKLRPLAYTMRKGTTGQNTKYDKAYFGWIKFESSAMSAPTIHAEIERNPNILRSMIINTVRENTLYTQKAVFHSPATAEGVKPEEVDPNAPKMSEEEMDKTIENLVVE